MAEGRTGDRGHFVAGTPEGPPAPRMAGGPSGWGCDSWNALLVKRQEALAPVFFGSAAAGTFTASAGAGAGRAAS